MSGKRSATTELNHDNWNEENEPEDAGTFAMASNDILEKRVIKTARRRLPSKDGSPTKSAFGTFAGFKTTPTTSMSPFSFLAGSTTASSTTTSTASAATTVNTSSRQIASNGAPKISEIDADKRENTAKLQTPSSTGVSKKISTQQGTEKTKNHSSDYYSKLKGLNESVATWIKSHVDANPFCILTPIFKDYERYLKEITSKEERTKAKTSQTSTQAAQNDSKQDMSTETKSEKLAFSNLNSNTKPALTAGAEWKPEKSIFSNITANTKSIFSNTEQKESPKSVFGNTDVTTDKSKSIFGNVESNVASKSIFGNTNVEGNPFLHKPTVSDDGNADEEETKSNAKSVAPTFPTFSFGQSSTASNVCAGFSFGSAKPFSFAPQAVKPQDSEDKADNENKEEEDEEPPTPDFKPVAEEGATYEQRCKVFVKKDNNFSDRGVGMLYLKPTPNGKTQLIVRADTALGSLLLNTLLTQSIPVKRMNKNTIMLVCLPMPDSSPPPIPVLLRVKTSEAADELLEALNKHKE
ncbi:nuclear pore complex protein Nup50 [Temnothorax curvispinosus]|uniref:Nuclear pore complex protein Nup50 n=1 Tax=Temnothorax curvispinosus TaxID=300111 RepID=A0A6J1PDT4_9HYME|nr:nuclear pore complex protein Nup50 [Temnothorax curvispinosus]XP_024867426.1 nuclear pore complex protein Nup50 [Temnothorax curvispinosus]XP_024867427.1 nuclear pore complex protein Nup50 [Temnothorax curvispinosus]XP_024867428.1 nuclear pore complex protein Nup50 [Temnothorax curvispinosus]XP_024867429.1 nuclear pore complex protein Nup50 [Temnothorax curvispinosus]XP_024867430.1 nuclear pore complex protein Nup50 [Temnothorax curvispinosus]